MVQNVAELSEADMDRSYHPIRRINQACLNCRRKKARCTGERPKCSNCKRLMTACHYLHNDGRKRRPAVSADMAEPYMIAESLHKIGSQLNEIMKQIDGSRSSSTSTTTQRECDSSPSNVEKQKTPDENTRVGPQDSTWINGESPDEDGRGYFPPLPSQDFLLRAINAYFSHCHNQPYCVFHESSFRRHFIETRVPDHLLFAVLCNSFRFLGTSDNKDQQTSERYADTAWSLVKSKCFSGEEDRDISTVQTVTLLSIFDFTGGRKRHRASWVRIGMAIRLAQQLGLMREPDSTLPLEEQEERRRIFWSLYLLDRLVSCGRNQPLAIADISCHLRLPCDELTWRASQTYTQQPYLNDVLHRKNTEDNLSSGALVMIAAKCLTRCTHYMLQDYYQSEVPEEPWHPQSDFASISSDLLCLESLLSFHHQLNQVLKDDCSTTNELIDPQLAGPVVFARLLFCLCQCILNHPFLLQTKFNCNRKKVSPPSFMTRALEAGRQFAVCLTNTVREARRAGFASHASFCGYCIAIAGTIHGFFSLSGFESKREEAQRNIDFSLDYLRDVSHFWINSRPMLHKLQEILDISKTYSNSSFEQCQQVYNDTGMYRSLWTLLDYNMISQSLQVSSQSPVNEHDPTNDFHMSGFDVPLTTGPESRKGVNDFIEGTTDVMIGPVDQSDHLLQAVLSSPTTRSAADFDDGLVFSSDDPMAENFQFFADVFTNIYE